jgi:cytochrome P450
MRTENQKGRLAHTYYPSANRGEEVFNEPFKFVIKSEIVILRDPNPHLAFGSASTSASAPTSRALNSR